MDRIILHCDMNAFFASVECTLDPRLKLVPMAVAGDPKSRHGIILAKNELAKAYNVKTAETIFSAVRKCPSLTIVMAHHDEYAKYSRLANEIYCEFTDLVEPFGIDESYLDVTGVTHIFGDGLAIANAIRARIHQELGLTISVGVSFNKIFAKLGSDYKKPDAVTCITRENYKAIIYPLPVSDLLFAGKHAVEALKAMYINTIGDLAAANRDTLVRRLKKQGGTLYDYANGLDDSPVLSFFDEADPKSIGRGKTFSRDILGSQSVMAALTMLADDVSTRLRANKLLCATVSLCIKDPMFKVIVRQKKLDTPTNLAKELARAAMTIFTAAWQPDAPIRALTLTASVVVKAAGCAVQTSLFDNKDKEALAKQERLESAIASIRQKHGKGAIHTLSDPLNGDK